MIADEWAWAHEEHQEELAEVDPSSVVGVMVVHNAQDWLERTLNAFDHLEDRPGVLLAVDSGSSDDSSRILYQARESGLITDVFHVDHRLGFGEAVNAGLAAYYGNDFVGGTAEQLFDTQTFRLPSRAADSSSDSIIDTVDDAPEFTGDGDHPDGTNAGANAEAGPAAPPSRASRGFIVEDTTHLDRPRWLWLIHDDMEPAPDALAHLLRAGDSGVDVVVPTLLLPKLRNHPDRIAEIGQSITRSGRRIMSPRQDIDEGDLDQRQQEPTDVLGASTAGLLINLKVWEELGGLDPALPVFRDGLDFGWRAHEANFTVRSCPHAKIYHRQHGRWNERQMALGDNPEALDHQLAMRVVAAHSTRPKLTRAKMMAASVVQAAGFLLGKAPRRSADRLRAAWASRRDGAVVDDMRQRNLHLAGESVSHLRPTPGQTLSMAVSRAAGAVVDTFRSVTGSDEGSDTSIDELTSDEFGTSGVRKVRKPVIVVGALAFTIVALVAGWHLLSAGKLWGLRLLPAPDSLSAAWSSWTTSQPGVGSAPAPWLFFCALGSLLTFGQPDWFATAMVLFGPLWAWMTAVLFFRSLRCRPLMATVFAAAWALMLPVMGLTGSGSLGASMVAMILPIFGIGVVKWLGTSDSDPWRTAGLTALTSVVLTSFYPLFLAVVLVVAILALVIRRHLAQALTIFIAPIVFLAGWWPHLWHNPGRFLTGIDPLNTPVGPIPSTFSLFLGRSEPSAAPLWMSATIMIILWSIGLLSTTYLRIPLWVRLTTISVGTVSVIFAAQSARQVVIIDGLYTRPSIVLPMLIFVACLLSLGAGAAAQFIHSKDALDVYTKSQHETKTPPHLRTAVSWVCTIAMAVVPILGASWWVIGGTSGLHRDTGSLPEYVSAVVDSPRQSRVLIVEMAKDRTTWSLLDATHPSWGTAEHDPVLRNDDATRAAANFAQQLAQGSPSATLADDLMKAGISHVVMRGASQDVIRRVNDAQGLSGAPSDQGSYVWTVSGLVSRYWISSGDNDAPQPILEGRVPEGGAGRVLVIAEPRDSRLHVSVGGQLLSPIPAPTPSDPAASPTDESSVTISSSPLPPTTPETNPSSQGSAILTPSPSVAPSASPSGAVTPEASPGSTPGEVNPSLGGVDPTHNVDQDASWQSRFALGEASGDVEVTMEPAVGTIIVQIVVLLGLLIAAGPSLARRPGARRFQ